MAGAVVALVFVISFGSTGLIFRFLKKRAILDHPSERSSHSIPTPKGAGIAIIAVVISAWLGLTWGTPAAGAASIVSAATLFLAVLSWIDDLKGLNPVWRLLGQGAAVAAVLIHAPPGGPFFGGLLPPFADLLVAGLFWMWFINLFNFMDGIDGIAGVETAAIGLGAALVALVAGFSPAFIIFGLILFAAALGFLWWNWHPAKIFLGDVGSVPLGFLLGWLLLGLAGQEEWAAGLILPLYYLADTTVTLIRRGLRGERVWRAHREHFYQQAVGRGLSHSDVVGHVLRVDMVLVTLAVMAASGWMWASLAGAGILVSWLLFFLGNGGKKRARAEPHEHPVPD